MSKIVVILDTSKQRQWQLALVERLKAAGYEVGIATATAATSKTAALDRVLQLEGRRFGSSLASFVAPRQPSPLELPDLVIDLAGSFAPGGTPVLRVQFNHHADFASGMAQMLAHKTLPLVTTHLNEDPVGVARPMLSDRLWLSRMADEVLAGALALIEQSVARFAHGALRPIEPIAAGQVASGFWRHYLPSFAGNIAQRAQKKLTTKRPFYWQVAYRQRPQTALNTSDLPPEPPFTVLPDDGERFYADPFVIEHQGKTWLFVEEYPYSKAKGVISVAEQKPDGTFDTPHMVLEEPYHLSYPQVFKHGEDIFMLPESGGARRLVLYRATSFPDSWAVDTVLLSGVDINDATLLERDGGFWLFGTERRSGAGSASDTMVVFHAPSMGGPWTPHKLNPIAIDRSAARPGGAFIEKDGRAFLPVQDGQHAYGGALGLMELLQLDHDMVVFAPPVPIGTGAAWDRVGIHTLNRAGSVEVVDSAG
ncbi:MAG TPA: hypothetical protein VGB81_01210 [Devosia sp.]